MNEDYNKAYDNLMHHEGGYSNHPADAGGETYKGIARNFHPSWSGWIIIDEEKDFADFPMRLNQNAELDKLVRKFYYSNYWVVNEIDAMQIYPLKREIFEIGVNMGIRTAAKILQEALNLLNRYGRNYDDLTIDGKIGNKTLTTISTLLHRGDGRILVNLINILQGERYINICRNNESQEVFLRGWLNRVDIDKKR